MSTMLRLEPEVAPRRLIVEPPLTDEELEVFCSKNDAARIERTREGVIQMNPPTGGLTGNGNSEIIWQLADWCNRSQKGRVFDSNTGFFLPDGSMLSPDAAYVPREQLAGMTKADLARMPRLCPAFVIELLSPSDTRPDLEKKMQQWILNGAQLAWLIDPYERCVLAYTAASSTRSSRPLLQGSGPVEGFTLDLARIWRCFEIE